MKTGTVHVIALPQSLPDTAFFDEPKSVGAGLFLAAFVALFGLGAWRMQVERR